MPPAIMSTAKKKVMETFVKTTTSGNGEVAALSSQSGLPHRSPPRASQIPSRQAIAEAAKIVPPSSGRFSRAENGNGIYQSPTHKSQLPPPPQPPQPQSPSHLPHPTAQQIPSSPSRRRTRADSDRGLGGGLPQPVRIPNGWEDESLGSALNTLGNSTIAGWARSVANEGFVPHDAMMSEGNLVQRQRTFERDPTRASGRELQPGGPSSEHQLGQPFIVGDDGQMTILSKVPKPLALNGNGLPRSNIGGPPDAQQHQRDIHPAHRNQHSDGFDMELARHVSHKLNNHLRARSKIPGMRDREITPAALGRPKSFAERASGTGYDAEADTASIDEADEDVQFPLTRKRSTVFHPIESSTDLGVDHAAPGQLTPRALRTVSTAPDPFRRKDSLRDHARNNGTREKPAQAFASAADTQIQLQSRTYAPLAGKLAGVTAAGAALQQQQQQQPHQEQRLQRAPAPQPIVEPRPLKRRRQALDYDDDRLRQMSYTDLKTQAFDFDPTRRSQKQQTSQQLEQPSSEDALHERLARYAERDRPAQEALFTRMAVTDWEKAGDWIMEKMSDVMGKMREARRKKRRMVETFETEIEERESAVRGKIEGIGRTLEDMKAEGAAMMKGREDGVVDMSGM